MNRIAGWPPAARTAAIAALALVLLAVLGSITILIALGGLGVLSGDMALHRIPAWLWYYRQDPELRRWLAIGGATSGLAAGLIGASAVLTRRRPLHGAARWGSGVQEGLRARSGIILGRGSDGGLLISDGPEHVMLYAPTRTGKGVGVVIPNLLAWPGSVVVLDIKRENYAATAGFRAESGQTVHLFDPLAPDGRTARFNPLGHIDRATPHLALDELQRIAAMLFTGHEHSDPFWSEAARIGFVGVGAYVAETPELVFSVGEILRQLTAEQSQKRFPALIRERRQAGRPLSTGCVSALTDFCGGSENTFASVRQSITSRLGLWLNPIVDAATSASDFELSALRGARVSLYLGASPENIQRVAPLYALLFQQLVDLNSRSLPAPQAEPILVLLDEFARLGPAPVLAHAFSWVAGYGLRLLPVIQSPSQLRGLYGSDLTDEILSNCGLEIIFAPKELRVAQEVSARLGDYTYRARSRSRPAGLSAGRRSLTDSDQRRPLMLPQELIQLPTEALIVLRAGAAPVRGRKIVYYRERAFRARLRPLPAPPAPVRPAPTPPPPPEETLAMDFESIARQFAAEGLPPPSAGCDEAEVAAWLDRVLEPIGPGATS